MPHTEQIRADVHGEQAKLDGAALFWGGLMLLVIGSFIYRLFDKPATDPVETRIDDGLIKCQMALQNSQPNLKTPLVEPSAIDGRLIYGWNNNTRPAELYGQPMFARCELNHNDMIIDLQLSKL